MLYVGITFSHGLGKVGLFEYVGSTVGEAGAKRLAEATVGAHFEAKFLLMNLKVKFDGFTFSGSTILIPIGPMPPSYVIWSTKELLLFTIASSLSWVRVSMLPPLP